MVHYLQGHGHSEGSHGQNMAVSTMSFELLILFATNLVLWNFVIRWSVL